MQVGITLGLRVLLGDVRTELHVLADRLTERLVVRQTGLVESLYVNRYESLPLLIGDLQMTVHVDDVLKTEPGGEAIRAAKRLGCEPCQVLDVGRHALGKHVLQNRVGERLRVEQLLERVQCLVSARVLVKRFSRLHAGER